MTFAVVFHNSERRTDRFKLGLALAPGKIYHRLHAQEPFPESITAGT
jgi:hypothetical protein